MKIKLFTKENNFKKKDFALNSGFYWKLVVGIAFTIIIISAVFSYHFFVEINREHVLTDAGEGGEVPSINMERFKKVLNYFSEKEQQSIKILNSPVPVVDPSR